MRLNTVFCSKLPLNSEQRRVININNLTVKEQFNLKDFLICRKFDAIMTWEERKILAELPEEKACKGLSPRDRAMEADLSFGNRQLYRDWALCRTGDTGSGASGDPDTASRAQP